MSFDHFNPHKHALLNTIDSSLRVDEQVTRLLGLHRTSGRNWRKQNKALKTSRNLWMKQYVIRKHHHSGAPAIPKDPSVHRRRSFRIPHQISTAASSHRGLDFWRVELYQKMVTMLKTGSATCFSTFVMTKTGKILGMCNFHSEIFQCGTLCTS